MYGREARQAGGRASPSKRSAANPRPGVPSAERGPRADGSEDIINDHLTRDQIGGRGGQIRFRR